MMGQGQTHPSAAQPRGRWLVWLGLLSFLCTIAATVMLFVEGFADWPWAFAVPWFALFGFSVLAGIGVIVTILFRASVEPQRRALAIVLSLPAVLFACFCVFLFVLLNTYDLAN
jgi:hypothetical protein